MNRVSRDRVEARFPGSPRYLPAVRALVREVLDRDHAHPVGDVSGILLAVHEAFVNAMRHGHGGNVARPVVLVIEDGPERLDIRVRDEGPGFVLSVPPATEPDATREGGRGLEIMQAVMDTVSVEHRDGITAVRLVKNKEPR